MSKNLGLFWLQLRVLIWKNWIILSKTPIVSVLVATLEAVIDVIQLSIVRCFILPIAYGVFLSFAQFLVHRLNNVCSLSLS